MYRLIQFPMNSILPILLSNQTCHSTESGYWSFSLWNPVLTSTTWHLSIQTEPITEGLVGKGLSCRQIPKHLATLLGFFRRAKKWNFRRWTTMFAFEFKIETSFNLIFIRLLIKIISSLMNFIINRLIFIILWWSIFFSKKLLFYLGPWHLAVNTEIREHTLFAEEPSDLLQTLSERQSFFGFSCQRISQDVYRCSWQIIRQEHSN